MIDMAKYVLYLIAYDVLLISHTHLVLQEGLKAHEGGQHTGNPFDIFQSFFGGRACSIDIRSSQIVFR